MKKINNQKKRKVGSKVGHPTSAKKIFFSHFLLAWYQPSTPCIEPCARREIIPTRGQYFFFEIFRGDDLDHEFCSRGMRFFLLFNLGST